jgi:hypothetical protein
MTTDLSGVRADRGFSYRDLEIFAGEVRDYLGLGRDDGLNALQLFENLDEIKIRTRDGKEVPLRGGVVGLEDSEGYTRYDEQRGVIEILPSELTYSWLLAGLPRAAYFVAHELGHCTLHTDQLVRLAQLPTQQQAKFHRGRADHRHCQDTEWQANAFASALLMPAKGIQTLERKHDGITAGLIAGQFGVSQEAAGYRLELYRARRHQLI